MYRVTKICLNTGKEKTLKKSTDREMAWDYYNNHIRKDEYDLYLEELFQNNWYSIDVSYATDDNTAHLINYKRN